MKKKIRHLENCKNTMYGKDHLLTWEKTFSEIKMLLNYTELLQEMHKENYSMRIFDSGIAVSNFRDKSTRTRFSFSSAANLLGLTVADLDEEKSQLSHGETVQETANMISFLTEVIGIRDDMFPGEGDRYQREVQSALEYGYSNGILPQKPTVINLQSDLDHPTQILADFSMLKSHFGSLEALKGKKIAMSWAYSPSYGKPMSVPQGVLGMASRFGMDISLAHPPGYELDEEIIKISEKQAAQSGGRIQFTDSMQDAFRGADIVYPKSWAPLNVMNKRTKILREGNIKEMAELEKEALLENAKYMNWECNSEMMKNTKNGNALYMHCLPADISGVNCRHGEVSEKVFRKYQKETYLEAGYKPFVIAAMILLSKVKEPAALLKNIINNNIHRRNF